MSGLPLERDAILRRAVELGASDLIVTAGHPVMMTVAGVLQPMPGSAVLSPADSRRVSESFLNPVLHERFTRDLELDTRYFLPGVAHFRVNLFIQRGHWGAAVRIVPLRIPLPAEIGLAPHVVEPLLGVTRGLVLVTGPDRRRQVHHDRLAHRAAEPAGRRAATSSRSRTRSSSCSSRSTR